MNKMDRSVLKNFFSSAMLLLSHGACLAASAQPQMMQEPLLGLRYETASTKFEPLPKTIVEKCDALRDDERGSSFWFVYAKFNDATGKLYIVGGHYFSWNDVPPDEGKFHIDDRGALLVFEGDKCTYLDEARYVFHKSGRLGAPTEEVPRYVLQRLAADYANRLERAFGGADRLRDELLNQQVDPEELPGELRGALKPYLAPSSSPR